jgi:hypothetical protein
MLDRLLLIGGMKRRTSRSKNNKRMKIMDRKNKKNKKMMDKSSK